MSTTMALGPTIVEAMKKWLDDNKLPHKFVVGISGGIDSSLVAKLAVEAVGKDNVYGVMLPNGEQKDIEDSLLLIEHLGINKLMLNIGPTYSEMLNRIQTSGSTFMVASEQTKINLAPRLRMAALYGVAQTVNGIVLNTCNLSESLMGYDTLFGDDCGSYAPIQDLTKTEVRHLAASYGLPKQLIDKSPADGLQGSTDEEKFGFTYEVLDKFIRTGQIDDETTRIKILARRQANRFKMDMIKLPGPYLAFLPICSTLK